MTLHLPYRVDCHNCLDIVNKVVGHSHCAEVEKGKGLEVKLANLIKKSQNMGRMYDVETRLCLVMMSFGNLTCRAALFTYQEWWQLRHWE